MDNELFELCKQVYEKTGWKDTLQCVWNGQFSQPSEEMLKYAQDTGYARYSPAYTSDYLLEKLPKGIAVHHFDSGDYGAYFYRKGRTVAGLEDPFRADTPIKALLKLTLALSEAGEL